MKRTIPEPTREEESLKRQKRMTKAPEPTLLMQEASKLLSLICEEQAHLIPTHQIQETLSLCNKIMLQKVGYLTRNTPLEIWGSILRFTLDSTPTEDNQKSEDDDESEDSESENSQLFQTRKRRRELVHLRAECKEILVFGRVCSTWKSMVDDLFRRWFFHKRDWTHDLILKFKDLESLNLTWELQSKAPIIKSFSELTNLKYLLLHGVCYRGEESVILPSSLKGLYLDGPASNIGALNVGELEQLERLSAPCFPPWRLTGLKSLEVTSMPKTSEIKKRIIDFPNLEQLTVCFSENYGDTMAALICLSDSLIHLPKLVALEIRAYDVYEFTKPFEFPSKLTRLSLLGVPQDITSFHNIKSLKVLDDYLITSGFSKFTQLTSLTIIVGDFPRGILWNFQQLVWLSVPIYLIPDISTLTNLKHLELVKEEEEMEEGDSQILYQLKYESFSIPSSILAKHHGSEALDNMTRLTKLDLRGYLNTDPLKNFSHLTSLTWLKLDWPDPRLDWFVPLTQLRFLFLVNNVDSSVCRFFRMERPKVKVVLLDRSDYEEYEFWEIELQEFHPHLLSQ